jgi:hypothetical protein
MLMSHHQNTGKDNCKKAGNNPSKTWYRNVSIDVIRKF